MMATNKRTSRASPPAPAAVPAFASAATASGRPSKRRRIDGGPPGDGPSPRAHAARPARDHISSLSDELLLRVLSYLPLANLLGLSPTSRRFHGLSSDSQLWRQLYYLHFVLPRAMRMPGFRPGAAVGGGGSPASSRTVMRHSGPDLRRYRAQGGPPVDWKRQYKLRHNWSRGKCAVEELEVGVGGGGGGGAAAPRRPARKQTLAKIADGIALTADAAAGLRAWDLKTKKLLAHAELRRDGADAIPTCMAVDEQDAAAGRLEIALGFGDGSFGVWALDVAGSRLAQRYRHPKSASGRLLSVAYAFPYLMAATANVVVSLYAFDADASLETYAQETPAQDGGLTRRPAASGEALDEPSRNPRDEGAESTRSPGAKGTAGQSTMAPPYLVTSLKSHSSRAPMALSLRKMATSTTAAIAYTLPAREGWTLGIQELRITGARPRLKAPAEVSESRLAHAAPMITGRSLDASASGSSSSSAASSSSSSSDTDDGPSPPEDDYGPMALCYTHPYLLATLPDNTLILYLCTTDATSLSISRGIRLWGHTSGIGDAEITSRGKAVSVSCRGDELRVWELEGRTGGRSVEIRPSASSSGEGRGRDAKGMRGGEEEWDDRRSWVGFDDEMVIVLKEAKSGRESLVVYDFS